MNSYQTKMYGRQENTYNLSRERFKKESQEYINNKYKPATTNYNYGAPSRDYTPTKTYGKPSSALKLNRQNFQNSSKELSRRYIPRAEGGYKGRDGDDYHPSHTRLDHSYGRGKENSGYEPKDFSKEKYSRYGVGGYRPEPAVGRGLAASGSKDRLDRTPLGLNRALGNRSSVEKLKWDRARENGYGSPVASHEGSIQAASGKSDYGRSQVSGVKRKYRPSYEGRQEYTRPADTYHSRESKRYPEYSASKKSPSAYNRGAVIRASLDKRGSPTLSGYRRSSGCLGANPSSGTKPSWGASGSAHNGNGRFAATSPTALGRLTKSNYGVTSKSVRNLNSGDVSAGKRMYGYEKGMSKRNIEMPSSSTANIHASYFKKKDVSNSKNGGHGYTRFKASEKKSRKSFEEVKDEAQTDRMRNANDRLAMLRARKSRHVGGFEAPAPAPKLHNYGVAKPARESYRKVPLTKSDYKYPALSRSKSRKNLGDIRMRYMRDEPLKSHNTSIRENLDTKRIRVSSRDISYRSGEKIAQGIRSTDYTNFQPRSSTLDHKKREYSISKIVVRRDSSTPKESHKTNKSEVVETRKIVISGRRDSDASGADNRRPSFDFKAVVKFSKKTDTGKKLGTMPSSPEFNKAVIVRKSVNTLQKSKKIEPLSRSHHQKILPAPRKGLDDIPKNFSNDTNKKAKTIISTAAAPSFRPSKSELNISRPTFSKDGTFNNPTTAEIQKENTKQLNFTTCTSEEKKASAQAYEPSSSRFKFRGGINKHNYGYSKPCQDHSQRKVISGTPLQRSPINAKYSERTLPRPSQRKRETYENTPTTKWTYGRMNEPEAPQQSNINGGWNREHPLNHQHQLPHQETPSSHLVSGLGGLKTAPPTPVVGPPSASTFGLSNNHHSNGRVSDHSFGDHSGNHLMHMVKERIGEKTPQNKFTHLRVHNPPLNHNRIVRTQLQDNKQHQGSQEYLLDYSIHEFNKNNNHSIELMDDDQPSSRKSREMRAQFNRRGYGTYRKERSREKEDLLQTSSLQGKIGAGYQRSGSLAKGAYCYGLEENVHQNGPNHPQEKFFGGLVFEKLKARERHRDFLHGKKEPLRESKVFEKVIEVDEDDEHTQNTRDEWDSSYEPGRGSIDADTRYKNHNFRKSIPKTRPVLTTSGIFHGNLGEHDFTFQEANQFKSSLEKRRRLQELREASRANLAKEQVKLNESGSSGKTVNFFSKPYQRKNSFGRSQGVEGSVATKQGANRFIERRSSNRHLLNSSFVKNSCGRPSNTHTGGTDISNRSQPGYKDAGQYFSNFSFQNKQNYHNPQQAQQPGHRLSNVFSTTQELFETAKQSKQNYYNIGREKDVDKIVHKKTVLEHFSSDSYFRTCKFMQKKNMLVGICDSQGEEFLKAKIFNLRSKKVLVHRRFDCRYDRNLIVDNTDKLWAVKNVGIKGFGDIVICLDFKTREDFEISLESGIAASQRNVFASCSSGCQTVVKGSCTEEAQPQHTYGYVEGSAKKEESCFAAEKKKKLVAYGGKDSGRKLKEESTESQEDAAELVQDNSQHQHKRYLDEEESETDDSEELISIKKGSIASNGTKNSFARRIKHDISVFAKDKKKNQIVAVYNSHVVKICLEKMKVVSIQQLGLKKIIDKIYSRFYKYLADSAYCSSTGILILAFRTPPPSTGYSTKSFADPNSIFTASARLCFFDLNRSTSKNCPHFLKEIIIGGKHRSKIEYLNSFGSLSVDPTEQFLLISGNQTSEETQSRAQILSLNPNNFLNVLASQNFKENVFTEYNYWLKDSNFILANGVGSLIMAKAIRSSIFGLKIVERKLDQRLISKDGQFVNFCVCDDENKGTLMVVGQGKSVVISKLYF